MNPRRFSPRLAATKRLAATMRAKARSLANALRPHHSGQRPAAAPRLGFIWQEQRDSTLDWQPGDIAVCDLRDGWFNAHGGGARPGPQRGEVRKVIAVHRQLNPLTGEALQFLSFSHYGLRRYLASAFSRIDPRAEAIQRADAAFIASLRRIMAPAPASARTPAKAPQPVPEEVSGGAEFPRPTRAPSRAPSRVHVHVREATSGEAL